MQLSELDPVVFKKLTVHLVGEQQFRADPVGSTLRTFEWLERVVSDEEGQESSRPLAAEIQRLAGIVKIKGVQVVAEELKVSASALKAWIAGHYSPSAFSLQNVKAFLANQEQPTPSDAAQERGSGPTAGDLFTQSQQQPASPVPAPQP
jgi:hypothetical protein